MLKPTLQQRLIDAIVASGRGTLIESRSRKYRDFGFGDLASLCAAQAEAISLARRAQRATRFDGAAPSPSWPPVLAVLSE